MSLGTLVSAVRARDRIAEYLRKTKWLPTKEVPDYSKDFYRYLIVSDVEPDELIKHPSLDAQLRSVNVEFKSRNGIKYQTVHYLQDYKHGPHIHLYSHTNPRVSDWDEVEQVIDEIVNGAMQNSKPNGNASLSPVRRIQMLKRPTAAGIACYLEAYKKYFGDVNATALFEHVPKSLFGYTIFSNLPPDRIRLVEYSQTT